MFPQNQPDSRQKRPSLFIRGSKNGRGQNKSKKNRSPDTGFPTCESAPLQAKRWKWMVFCKCPSGPGGADVSMFKRGRGINVRLWKDEVRKPPFETSDCAHVFWWNRYMLSIQSLIDGFKNFSWIYTFYVAGASHASC